MLIECHECGGKVSTEAKACVNCGAPPRTPILCKECGIAVPPNSGSCIECGASVRNLLTTDTSSSRSSKPILKPAPTIELSPGVHRAGLPARNRAKTPVNNVREKDHMPTIWQGIFSITGRIGRSTYWAVKLILFVGLVLLMMIAGEFLGILIPRMLLMTVFTLAFLPTYIKRLHDLGYRDDWILVPLIQLILAICTSVVLPKVISEGQSYPILAFLYTIATLASFILSLMLGFTRGHQKANRYGPPPTPIRWK